MNIGNNIEWSLGAFDTGTALALRAHTGQSARVSEPMTKRYFVDALVEAALEQVVSREVATMVDPPGRRPSLDLVARSEWFRQLPEDDRSMVVDALRSTAYGVLHTVLCVLDGVAAIESGPNKGVLKLRHERDGVSTDLTSHAEVDLHDLLAEHR